MGLEETAILRIDKVVDVSEKETNIVCQETLALRCSDCHRSRLSDPQAPCGGGTPITAALSTIRRPWAFCELATEGISHVVLLTVSETRPVVS